MHVLVLVLMLRSDEEKMDTGMEFTRREGKITVCNKGHVEVNEDGERQ